MSAAHVHVRVAAEAYAIPVAHVVEVGEIGSLTSAPGSAGGNARAAQPDAREDDRDRIAPEAQDEATSAIYGMPRSAAERGADRILPLGGIAVELCGLSLSQVAA
jgi:hypothetical protein